MRYPPAFWERPYRIWPLSRAGCLYRFPVCHYEAVTSGRRDIRLNAKPRGVGLPAICPGDQRCRKIRAGDLGERIDAANARIEINHIAAVPTDKQIAV